MFLEVSGNISEGGFRFSVHFKHQPNMVGGYGVGNHFLCADTLYHSKVDAWDGAVTKQHEHANKTVLDGISAEKVADWDSKAAGNHEHDITELKQASGYIIFNCGSATLNI